MREFGGIETDVLDVHREQIVAGVFEAGAVEEEVCGGAFPPHWQSSGGLLGRGSLGVVAV